MPYRAAHEASASTCSGEGGPDGCGRASPTAGRASSRTNRGERLRCVREPAGGLRGAHAVRVRDAPRGDDQPAGLDDEAVAVDEELELHPRGRGRSSSSEWWTWQRDHVAGMSGDLGQRPIRPLGVDADGVVEKPEGLGGLVGERGLHCDLLDDNSE